MDDVLVVEDDELMRALVSEWLSQAGYAVRQAADGDDAVATLQQEPAALVITDMSMPRRNGAQTLQWLHREHSAIPVIAMSGHFAGGRGYTREGAVALGASRVLAKPFREDELLDAVRQLIGAPLPPERETSP